ncbi:MAG TPA: hypothetical protein VJN21_10305 [Candidatus Acidoferrales bacterium]|nr:hypothetical protein [Candidatus Acidoferrales bacterium]
MKLAIRTAGFLAGLFLLVPGVMRAQQASSAPTTAMTHLRVDLVLTEFNGEKKISSLPYTMYVLANPNHENWESLRMGVKVAVADRPVPASVAANPNLQSVQFNWQNMGTNIDCFAQPEGDGRYQVGGKIDRSSIYSADQTGGAEEQPQVLGGMPIMRSFNSGFNLVLRDGETGEGVSATDPFNGHVLKVSVTIHVVK